MVATTLMTAAELQALGEDARIELIEGEPAAKSPTGARHAIVSARITRQLTRFALTHPACHVLGNEGGYVLGTNPDTVLAPDIAVLTDDQFQQIAFDNDAFMPIAPALVIEIKSPSDRESEIARNLAIYLHAGVREIWWIRPSERQMTVHRPDRAPEYVGADQTFTGSDVLPEFTLPMPDLLNPESTPK